MEFEHKLSLRIMLSEVEEANLNTLVEQYKLMYGVEVSPDDMLQTIIAHSITASLGGGCGGGCHGGCHGDGEGGCGGGCHEESEGCCGCHD